MPACRRGAPNCHSTTPRRCRPTPRANALGGWRKEVEEAAEAFRIATEAGPGVRACVCEMGRVAALAVSPQRVPGRRGVALAQTDLQGVEPGRPERRSVRGTRGLTRTSQPRTVRATSAAPSANPSCEYARIRFAMLLAGRGRVEEAVEQVDQAQKLNQRSSLPRGYLGHAALRAPVRRGRPHVRDAAAPRLPYTAAHIGLCKAYTELRRSADALAACQSVGAEQAAEYPFVLSQLVKIHHDAGRPRERSRPSPSLRALYDARPTGDGAFWIALAYVSLGDTPRALDWLDKAIDANSSPAGLRTCRLAPRSDSPRPAFIARMARIDKGPRSSTTRRQPGRQPVNAGPDLGTMWRSHAGLCRVLARRDTAPCHGRGACTRPSRRECRRVPCWARSGLRLRSGRRDAPCRGRARHGPTRARGIPPGARAPGPRRRRRCAGASVAGLRPRAT